MRIRQCCNVPMIIKKCLNLYKNNYDPEKFRKAAENIRVQQGIKDRFEQGLSRMHLYLDQIKKVFVRKAFRKRLRICPLVESSFNNQSFPRLVLQESGNLCLATARSYHESKFGC